MKFQGALVKEQGVTFGIIIVKLHVLNSPSETASMRGGAESVHLGRCLSS